MPPVTDNGDKDTKKEPKLDKIKMLKQAEMSKKEATHYMVDDIPWELCRENEGIAVYKSLSEDLDKVRHVFKAECTINTNVETLAFLMHPVAPYRIQWDRNISRMEILDQVSPNTLVVHHCVKPHFMGLIAGRDSIHLSHFVSPAENAIAAFSNEMFPFLHKFAKMQLFSSVDYPLELPPGVVRAWSYPSGIGFFKTEDPNVTNVKSVFHADINLPRVIPLSLIEAGIPREIQHFHENLRDAAKSFQVEKTVELPGWSEILRNMNS